MTPYQALMADAAKMNDAQLKSFTQGVSLIIDYLSGKFIGTSGNAKLVVSALDRQTLVLNAMAYLSKFAPTQKFKTLYRVHDAKGIRVEQGQDVRIKPFRSFLSWSEVPTISVEGTKNISKEILLGINGGVAQVVFSYKTAISFKVTPVKDARLRGLAKQMEILRKDAVSFEAEREVVVYHAKPFIAKVLRVHDGKKVLKDVPKEIGISKFLEKKVNTLDTNLAMFPYDTNDRERIEELITKFAGPPKQEEHDKRHGDWRWYTKTYCLRMSKDYFTVELRKR